MKSCQSEKEEASWKESIELRETLKDEDLAEEEEVDANEALKAIKKSKRRSEPVNYTGDV